MKLILDKGVISCEPGNKRSCSLPAAPNLLNGFVLWAYQKGLRGLDSHFGFPVEPAARRLKLTNLKETREARKWANRISRGQVSINGRIVCTLDRAQSDTRPASKPNAIKA